MKVEIDSQAGFCFGVTRVINKAEEIIKQDGKLYCLGEIVHNQKEISRLVGMGLKIISYDEYLQLSDCRVLIRAHGEPPETYSHALKNNIELIDGTCPIVLHLQNRIKKDFTRNHENGSQIVIFGKKDHAEVKGLAGQIHYKTIIVESENDLDSINFNLPVHLYAQTTMNLEKYEQLKLQIIKRTRKSSLDQKLVKCTNSICSQVSGRAQNLKKFCEMHDLVLFVSYVQSSNGKLLFARCKSMNDFTYFVSETSDVMPEWLENRENIGITGATSTPRWLLEEFADYVTALNKGFLKL
jgi:4-hydroxy-3-methylbut-2-enyl diphosphate reductase